MSFSFSFIFSVNMKHSFTLFYHLRNKYSLYTIKTLLSAWPFYKILKVNVLLGGHVHLCVFPHIPLLRLNGFLLNLLLWGGVCTKNLSGYLILVCISPNISQKTRQEENTYKN
jgi:hypothetical protein